MLCIGPRGLFFESSLAVWDLWFGLFVIFSGYLLPLELLPRWLGAIVEWSPFPYLLSYPVQTVLGLLDRGAALRALGISWLYASGFVLLALVLWRRVLLRYAAYGG
jgi:ABC-2 type transport system permease protein